MAKIRALTEVIFDPIRRSPAHHLHHLLSIIGIAAIVVLLLARAAAAEPLRVGIVITNEAYEKPELAGLKSPHKAGDFVEDALWQLQFEIIVRKYDVAAANFDLILDEIKRQLGNRVPDVIFLFYSGHGATFANRGDNYLFPVNFDPHSIAPASTQAPSLSHLLEKINQWGPAPIVLAIDACRTTVEGRTENDHRLDIAANSDIGSGFIKPSLNKGFLNPTRNGAPIYISFSSGLGASAPDTTTYAATLAQNMILRGLDVPTLFSKTQKEVATVAEDNNTDQIPYIEDGLGATSAWLQSAWPISIAFEQKAFLSVPAGRQDWAVVDRKGQALWVQSGRWWPDSMALLTLAGADNSKRWSISLGSFKQHYVVDYVVARQNGNWLVGGHTEAENVWKPYLIELTDHGEILRRVDLSPIQAGLSSTVHLLSEDYQGDVWALVGELFSHSPTDRMVLGQIKTGSEQVTLHSSSGDASDIRSFNLYAMHAFTGSEIRERYCMFLPHRPQPCAPMVLAVGALRDEKTGVVSGLVSEFRPSGDIRYNVTTDSSTELWFTWLGVEPCCRMVGYIVGPRTTEFLFGETDMRGFIDHQRLVRFLPPDETSCAARSAVEFSPGRILVVGDCGHSRVYVATFDERVGVTGFARVCGTTASCLPVGILRLQDGPLVVGIRDQEGVKLFSIALTDTPGTPIRLISNHVAP